MIALQAMLLLFMVVCAFAAMTVRDLIESVILFGAFSFFSVLLFTSLGALDVAFTEAVVGGVVTTVFFAAALYRSDRRASR